MRRKSRRRTIRRRKRKRINNSRSDKKSRLVRDFLFKVSLRDVLWGFPPVNPHRFSRRGTPGHPSRLDVPSRLTPKPPVPSGTPVALKFTTGNPPVPSRQSPKRLRGSARGERGGTPARAAGAAKAPKSRGVGFGADRGAPPSPAVGARGEVGGEPKKQNLTVKYGLCRCKGRGEHCSPAYLYN